MSTFNTFKTNSKNPSSQLRPGLLTAALSNISTTQKMALIVSAFFLGILGISISTYIGLQNLRYQLSNIYDFMLVPIVSINEAESALTDAQFLIAQSKNADMSTAEQKQNLETIQARNQTIQSIISRYDKEWVTTVSSEFTQSLKKAGKLDLQKREVVALQGFHTSFDAYLENINAYLASVQAGKPNLAMIEHAIRNLTSARQNLQTLTDINNQYADFSNGLAQAAYRQALVTGIILLGMSIIVGSLVSYLIVVSITSRLSELTQSATAMQQGNLGQTVDVMGRDEISLLGVTLNAMAAQLNESIATLEQRVEDRTRNLEFAAEVGRAVSQVTALDVMLKNAAEIIRSRFDLYYVQVYLTNRSQTSLILRAGTGNAGEQLLARSHQLPFNTNSINGRAAVEKRSIVISQTAANASFHPNPLLSDTQSEMAVPLIVGEKVVGVLDMQSATTGSLSQENLVAFEALAGQLAVAIQNANLLDETVQARAEVENQVRRLARSNWQDYLDAIHTSEFASFVFDGNEVMSLEDLKSLESSTDSNPISTPIEVAGAAVGSIVVSGLTPEKLELVNVVAQQVAQKIEGLRLLENAERYRLEAEEVARRTTIEGWKKYVESRPERVVGYLYDSHSVKALEEQPQDAALKLPIQVGDQTVGKFTVLEMEGQQDQPVEIAKAVVERLGTHIENLRLLEETRRGQDELNKRAQDLAAVSEISSASAKELDIQKLLESVVHLTQRKFGLYHAHIFTFSDATSELQIAACGWRASDKHEGTHDTTGILLTQEQSLVARAGRTHMPVIVNDVSCEPGWLPNPLLPDTKSEMAVPIILGDQLLGVLDVQSDELNAFSQEDASIQVTLAAQIATALQNARSFEQAQRQAERESMLNAIGQKIQGATSVEAVLQIAARELGRAFGARRAVAQLGIHPNNGNHMVHENSN